MTKYISIFALIFLFALGGNIASADERVAGDFMVVFKIDALISSFGKDAPDPFLNAMLDYQGEYLKAHYGVEILGTYPEITRSNGKGMFHVHSKKAALSESMFDAMAKKLREDPQIESVSENRIKRISIK